MELYAERMKYAFDTPGISTGYWNARKTPACARSSGGSASRSLPSKVAEPPVTSYAGISREHLRERALAGAVGPHDRVHFAGGDAERDPAEDVAIASLGVEVLYFEHEAIILW